MLKPNIKYLVFDDRMMMMIGIPIISVLIPPIFFGLDITVEKRLFLSEYPKSLVFSASFWWLNRALMIYLRTRYNAFSQSLLRITIQVIIIILAAPIVSSILAFIVFRSFSFLDIEKCINPTFLQGMSAIYMVTFLIVLIYDVIFFLYKYKEAISEKDRIKLAHIQGQLDNLRNQINPHFLFNSLNTLMSLIPEDPKNAMNFLDKLSKFYRYTVSNQDQTLVSLQTELDNVVIYRELLQERFQEGLHIEIKTDKLHNVKILPLSLQLLIENAIKHNIVSRKRPLTITIKTICDNTYIQVLNNKQKKISEVLSTGLGLNNIKKRTKFFTKLPVIVTEENDHFSVAVPLIFSNPTYESSNNRR